MATRAMNPSAPWMILGPKVASEDTRHVRLASHVILLASRMIKSLSIE